MISIRTMDSVSWENPFGVMDDDPMDLGLDLYLGQTEPGLQDHLESQPHGGALLRHPKTEDVSAQRRQSLAELTRLAFPPSQGAEPWPPGLVFDLALGIDGTQEVLDRYSISAEEYEVLMENAVFRAQLLEHMRRNRQEGVTFARKTAQIAEECLPEMYSIIKDPLSPVATRVDTWKHMARLGNLEPKSKDSGTTGNIPMVNIQINL